MICILHGISIGLAIDLSSCADIRLCAADTRMAVKEVDIGLAADIGTLSRLPKAVGSSSWVKDVCLSARFFDAAEALRVGFVSEVHESKAAAVAAGVGKAALLAEKSPVAVQGTKELLNHARDHSVDESRSILPAPAPSLPCLRQGQLTSCPRRSAVHRCLELGHAPVKRRLFCASVWDAEEEADVREAIDIDHCDLSSLGTCKYLQTSLPLESCSGQCPRDCPALGINPTPSIPRRWRKICRRRLSVGTRTGLSRRCRLACRLADRQRGSSCNS